MSIYKFTLQDLIKDDRINEKDFELLKHCLKTQKLPKFSDETIALFFMACKNDIENTIKCANAYYSAKCNAPELFDDRDVTRKDVQHQLQILNFAVFPRRTDDGYVIIFHRLVNCDPSQYEMEVAMKVLFMTMDTSLYEKPATGIITLFDMRGVCLRHLTRIRLGAIRKFFHYLQEALPLQLREIHVLNCVWFIEKVLKIIKPFVNAEVLEHLHLHTSDINMNEFYEKWIPKKCLPCDYGGELDCVQVIQNQVVEKMGEMKEFFVQEQIQRTM